MRVRVGQVDEQLGEAALGGGVVAQHRREGVVAQRLGQALPEGFAGAGVIAQSILTGVSLLACGLAGMGLGGRLTSGSTELHA